MSKYVKRPIPVEAVQWFPDAPHPAVGPISTLIPEAHGVIPGTKRPDCTLPLRDHGVIGTIEGDYTVCPGDWIITGVRGEQYPCEASIFAETYQPVEEASGHEIVVTHEGDHAEYRVVCHEPVGADCRLTCPDPGCESWVVEREGGEPFHTVETIVGDPIRHAMSDSGECSAAEWLNYDGWALPELGRGTFEVGRFPITPVWDDDDWTWKRREEVQSRSRRAPRGVSGARNVPGRKD